MLRGFIALILVAGALGCGNEDEVAELRAYAQTIKGFEAYNEQVEATIVRFDDPTQEITAADIATARKLIDEYSAAVEAMPTPEESMLKNTHALYQRAFDEAKRLANDETGDIKRQAHSAAIGLRSLRREVEGRFYPTLELILTRNDLTGDDYALDWVKQE